MSPAALARAAICGAGCLLVAERFAAPVAQERPPAPSSSESQAGSADQLTFTGGTEAVLVDVYPRRNGRVVHGLTAEQFQVFENGQRQYITSFEFVDHRGESQGAVRRDPTTVEEMRGLAASPHQRVFVVFLDRAHTTVEGANRVRGPLIDLLERMLGADDLFGVMLPEMRPTHITFGRDTTSIEAQLRDEWAWGSRGRLTAQSRAIDPMEDALNSCFEWFHPPPGDLEGPRQWYVEDRGVRRRLDDIAIERRREETTLAGLEALVSYLGATREARSVVVAVTDGWVLFEPDPTLEDLPAQDRRLRERDPEFLRCTIQLQHLASYDGAQRLRNLISLAARHNVSFYPLASAGLAAFDTDLSARVRPSFERGTATGMGWTGARIGERIQGLKQIAESTDGLAIVNTNDLTGGVQRIVEDLSAYYLLTYVPTNPSRDGRYRTIEVRVDMPDVSVHARRGYVASAGAALSRNPPASATPVAVTDALAVLNRRGSAEVFVHGALAGNELRVAVELSSTLASQPWLDGAPVSAAVTAESGESVGSATARFESNRSDALLTMPAPAGPGPWTVTVTVGDGVDRPREQFVVMRPADEPLGNPMVFRGSPSLRSPLRPVASFTFSRRERIHVVWPVLQEADRHAARLLNKQGQPVPLPLTVSRTDAPDGARLTTDLTLGSLAVSDYVIELTAGTADRSTVSYVAFRIQP